MATLIQVDGSERQVLPASGQAFTLEELQALVGGYVEPLRLPSGDIVLLDEDGKLKQKPKNGRATTLVRSAGIAAADFIVGDVLVCSKSELD